MATPAHCDPRNADLPEGDPNRYNPNAASKYFGAGTYRVTHAFRTGRTEHKPGDTVQLSDAEAGVNFDKIEHADPEEAAHREAAAKAVIADAANN